jgi:hypothetical protein
MCIKCIKCIKCITCAESVHQEHQVQHMCIKCIKCSTCASHVQDQCIKSIKRLGDLFGRDRMFIGTVAFGPPSEDYAVLQGMAAALPRSSFQKLGLSGAHLRTAFTSLTSSLTTLRTEAGGGSSPLTLRSDVGKHGQRQEYEESQVRRGQGEKALSRALEICTSLLFGSSAEEPGHSFTGLLEISPS